MAWNGSGTFSPSASYYPEVNGTVIDAVRYNGLMLDLAAGINSALAKDGQNSATGNLKLGGYKLTGLGAGTQAGDAVRWEQVYQIGVTNITANNATLDLANVLTSEIILTPGGTNPTSFGTAPVGRSYRVSCHPTTATPGTAIVESASIILPEQAKVLGFSDRVDILPGTSFQLTSLGSGNWQITNLVRETANRQPYAQLTPPTIINAGTGATVTGDAYAFTITLGTSPSTTIATNGFPGGYPIERVSGSGFYIVQSSRASSICSTEDLGGSPRNFAFGVSTATAGDKIYVMWAG